ncbi:bifunctional 3'-5' exonuclease/DNA polymerase [Microbacterium sp. MPKO10]|uniref:bifunctional 3'-5' exonuclease/DNA polymerase n=1 Tax=Microbacterium sp. MPKO10 TaxID=2989818 RepID=UPI002235B340|nr:bifunctional 3'-5' exonuclease/DNA polymerase [Microbacterium sp. MPKO10]MCW4457936.1 bifunctional 3'-5' exonuclease/DNA polymerase [Microbacterium sp. MPKO10]
MHVVIEPSPTISGLRLVDADETGQAAGEVDVSWDEAPTVLAQRDQEGVRWVFGHTAELYPQLVERGVRLSRSHDLALCRTILRRSTTVPSGEVFPETGDEWDAAWEAARGDDGLTGFAELTGGSERPDAVAELQRQLAAVAASTRPARLRSLLAAESCGALIAVEIRYDGLPWRRNVHERLLTEALGPRPVFGGRPAVLERLADSIRTELDAPGLNPDSHADLLRALRSAGITVESTSKWELQRHEHPVIEPLLRYKSLSRLMTANGWAWLDEWVHDDRFRPEYIVAGVVTGRWATDGGGALQLPAQIRPAVVADEGWTFVIADAAQLEPRIVAAMAGDTAMAAAGYGTDLYQGLVDAGTVDTRQHAKIAMLGALYGATTGESARLMPRLMRAYPRATGLVEAAARAGERGEQVTTWLGRSSPEPSEGWRAVTRAGAQVTATPADERAARRAARDWGRFTRNFVAQGTAAEWALCWMAELRHRLRPLGSGEQHPHLVYFLHDELVIHTPEQSASLVAEAVRDAAAAAGRGLFGDFPIDFPLDVAIECCYADA